MIEKVVIDYLSNIYDCKVLAEEPEKPPTKYIVVEKLSGGYANGINSARIAVQTHEKTLAKVSAFDEDVCVKMRDFVRLDKIGGCVLENSYNFTDTSTKRYRYQSVFDIRYYD